MANPDARAVEIAGKKMMKDSTIARNVAELRRAAQKVYDGLNARIVTADPSAVPVFDGIADLHAALNKRTTRP